MPRAAQHKKHGDPFIFDSVFDSGTVYTTNNHFGFNPDFEHWEFVQLRSNPLYNKWTPLIEN